MRTPHPAPRARFRRPLCALVLAIAFLLAPAAARAQQGRLLVEHFAVEACEELGTCEWKVTCKIGGGSSADVLANGIGGEGQEIKIDRIEKTVRFPLTVACTLHEDDGILGTSYKEVATGSITLPAGGDYRLTLTGAGQGGGHLLLRADSLEVASAPPQGDPRRFLAVFRSSEEGHAVLLGADAGTFEARRAALAKLGVQPVLLETYAEGKQRLWNAVFRTASGGNGDNTVVTGLEWEPFKAKVEELEGKGTPIADFATYVEGKKRLFAGIFQPSQNASTLVVGQSANAFQNQFNRLAGQGMRLTDFEVYRSGRDVLYTGVFVTGSGSQGFRTGLDSAAFEARLKEGGSRLSDVETYLEGKKPIYAIGLRGSTGEVAVENGIDATTFATHWRDQLGKGLRLVDFETLSGGGSEE